VQTAAGLELDRQLAGELLRIERAELEALEARGGDEHPERGAVREQRRTPAGVLFAPHDGVMRGRTPPCHFQRGSTHGPSALVRDRELQRKPFRELDAEGVVTFGNPFEQDGIEASGGVANLDRRRASVAAGELQRRGTAQLVVRAEFVRP